MFRPLVTHGQSQDAYHSNPAAAPLLIWFLARVIREVKSAQEALAMQCSVRSEGMLGFAIKRPELSLELHRTWQLRVVGYLMRIILFGSHDVYRTRLESTRFGMTVYLGEFRKAIRGFLDEWAGEHSPTQLLAKCANLWR